MARLFADQITRTISSMYVLRLTQSCMG